MANQYQQMPIRMKVAAVDALTSEDVQQIKDYIERETLLEVEFEDADGEVMVPVGFTPEVQGDDSVTPATFTVIKGGSVKKCAVKRPTYDFTSYEADKTTKIADGVVEVTGRTEQIEDQGYKEVEVMENTVPEWVGMKFLVIDTATADGTTKYAVYNLDGTDTGMWVTISVPE